MAKNCDARMKPFPDETELRCEKMVGGHSQHTAVLRDYAYPGSKTEISWFDDDRRNYYGEWPGRCTKTPGCVLPKTHERGCAV